MMALDAPDAGLERVCSVLKILDPDGRRAARVLRETLDQLYDGQRTGRFSWEQLYKTEKTHCGTLVEINLQREFQFTDGTLLDYSIAGIDVDCKYSQQSGAWMIPPEAHDHICLVLWADDRAGCWSMGLVRASLDHLGSARNRDGKATLNPKGRQSIHWLFENAPLPPNILLQLDAAAVSKIMAQSSGQRRVNELFRAALGLRVGRGVIATVAQEFDYMKRVRANGGARDALLAEGILILGQYEAHVRVARELGVAAPGPGESVSVRLSRAEAPGPGVTDIDGSLWRLARPDDRIIPAPKLPDIRHAREEPPATDMLLF